MKQIKNMKELDTNTVLDMMTDLICLAGKTYTTEGDSEFNERTQNQLQTAGYMLKALTTNKINMKKESDARYVCYSTNYVKCFIKNWFCMSQDTEFEKRYEDLCHNMEVLEHEGWAYLQ